MIALILAKPGVLEAHVVSEGDEQALLCVHYDPHVVALSQVENLARAAGASVSERYGHALLRLRAIDAEDAAPRIERSLLGLDGVLGASVNLPAQQARVEFDRSQTDAEQISAALRDMNYGAAVSRPAGHAEAGGAPEEPENWYARNSELVWSLIAGALLLVAFLGERYAGLPSEAAIALYLGAYGFGAFDLVRHSLSGLRRGHFSLDIDLLMLLAAVGAAILGAWAEGAFLLFLFSLAHALEHYALGRARNAIRALADLAPSTARVQRGGSEIDVPVEQVATGDIVVVRPGERIPVDGEVRAGRSAVNQAPITGESAPIDKEPGDEVFAGTVNGEGALDIVTTRAAGDRTLDRVVQLVEEAQTQKAPTQQFTERFERVFVPLVLAGVVLVIVVPPLLDTWSWDTSVYRGMALLVAASPCALALGTPSAVLAGIAQAARRGVLIKGGAHLEQLGGLRAIALDKTGTITIGKPEVTDLIAAEGVTEDELLRVAAAVERRSQHPLAEAIVRRAEARGMPLPEAGELQSVTGRGVRSAVEGAPVEIGSLRLWEDAGQSVPESLRAAVERLQANGRSTMAVRHGETWLGVIGMADQPRPDVKAVLNRLRALGMRPLVMLTGDNNGVGQAIGREVGIDEVRAELLPEDKVTAVRELLRQHGKVAMIGDGVNDAPALANATVGIAMGGAGTAVALETADVALMGDDLGRLPFAIGLSRRARGIIRQNVILSLSVVALLIVATTTGVFNIAWAVLLHEASTLVVIGNALRLLAYEAE